MQKEKIFGIPIDNISMAKALKMAKEMLENKKQHKIFTLNPEILLLGRKNQDYKKVFAKSVSETA